MSGRIHTATATVYEVPLAWPWFHALCERAPALPTGARHEGSCIRRCTEEGHPCEDQKIHHVLIAWCGSEASLRAELVRLAAADRFAAWTLGYKNG